MELSSLSNNDIELTQKIAVWYKIKMSLKIQALKMLHSTKIFRYKIEHKVPLKNEYDV